MTITVYDSISIKLVKNCGMKRADDLRPKAQSIYSHAEREAQKSFKFVPMMTIRWL